MPKQVDHEERRRRLAQAVWVITATRGLEAATLREVAAEAGVSMGSVQHYFRTKEAMLVYACEHLVELAGQGMRALLAESDRPDAPASVVRAIAVQTLPLDEQQRLGTSVWYSFIAKAVVDPALRAVVRRAWADAHTLVAEQLRRAQRNGEVAADLDPEREADTLLCLVDGLVSRLLVDQRRAEEATAIVDDHLRRVFSRPPPASETPAAAKV